MRLEYGEAWGGALEPAGAGVGENMRGSIVVREKVKAWNNEKIANGAKATDHKM